MLKHQSQHRTYAEHEGKEPSIFVIHAGEDKDSFVRPLVSSLQKQGLAEEDIFFDDVSIRPGDVIRERIISTLSSESLKLAVIVVSTSFINKPYWPKLEFETCLKNDKHLFPIWVDANEDNFKAFSESVGKYSPTLKQLSARRVQRDDVTFELPNIAAEIVERLSKLKHHVTQPEAIQTLLQVVLSSSTSDSSYLEEETSIEEEVCGAGNIAEQPVDDILKAKAKKRLELFGTFGGIHLQFLKNAEGLLSAEEIEKRTKKLLDTLYEESLPIIKTEKGCAIVHLVPNNQSTLDSFWRDYKSGQLSSYLTNCLVTDEMRAAAGQDLAVWVVMLDKQYRQWTDYFNTRDLGQMVQTLPSLTMTTLPARERPSFSPIVSLLGSEKATEMSFKGPTVTYIDKHKDVSYEEFCEEKEKKTRALREQVEREHRKLQEAERQDEEKRRQFQKQEVEEEQRQAERLRKLQQEALSKREKLLKYRFGDKYGLRSFASIDISDMQQSDRGLRIGLFGPKGSGKSSFIKTCERALKQTTTESYDTQTSGAEGTIFVQEYLDDIGSNFCLIDTRGFFNYSEKEYTAMTNIAYGRIKPGERIDLGIVKEVDMDDSWDTFSNWLHAVVIVMSVWDPLLLRGYHRTDLDASRGFMRPRGISPVTVVTHVDQVKDESQLEQIKTKASAATGSPNSHVFFIENYHPEHNERDFSIELRAMEILNSALTVGERYVKIHKLQRLYVEEEKQAAAVQVVAKEPIEDFFRRLCDTRRIPDEKVEPVIAVLKKEDVRTARMLRDTWNELEAELPIGSQLKSYIKDALFGDST